MSQVLTIARRGLSRPAAPARDGFADALRAEWTKLRTTPGCAWILAAVSVLTVAVSAATAAASKCQAGSACAADLVAPTRIRFEPATSPLVGSYSTQPAPGK